jgi:hypothetical protein
LAVCAPILASIFAFSYVVGYFYASDISWFPFFSLSEHLVFAIRALPTAIGALAVTFSGVYSSTSGRKNNHDRTLLNSIALFVLVISWMCVLLCFSIYMFTYNYIGLSATFLAVAMAAVFFQSSGTLPPLLVHIAYWGISIATLCVLFGFVSGSAWQCHSSFLVTTSLYISTVMAMVAAMYYEGTSYFLIVQAYCFTTSTKSVSTWSELTRMIFRSAAVLTRSFICQK